MRRLIIVLCMLSAACAGPERKAENAMEHVKQENQQKYDSAMNEYSALKGRKATAGVVGGVLSGAGSFTLVGAFTFWKERYYAGYGFYKKRVGSTPLFIGAALIGLGFWTDHAMSPSNEEWESFIRRHNLEISPVLGGAQASVQFRF